MHYSKTLAGEGFCSVAETTLSADCPGEFSQNTKDDRRTATQTLREKAFLQKLIRILLLC